MAKGKSLNPADAFRKAQRKKELKKNKTERTKTRDFALVKKDTWDLEDEIKRLEEADESSEQARLAELKAELEKINRKKAEYVAEHPEQRRLVYRPHRKEGDKVVEEPIFVKRNLFDKNGLPRHPDRSVYYDPIMNPFGVAPPGMPYTERPPRPGEVWSDDGTDEDEDEIVMPPGLPPGTEEVDSDDEIPMPEGPPPLQFGETSGPFVPPLPPGPPPGMYSLLPGLPPHLGSPMQMVLPPRPDFSMGNPPPPPGIPPPPRLSGIGLLPPPLVQGFSQYPPSFHGLPNPPPGFPPPPPGFFPRNQSTSSMQDPLSAIPHQTFQAHRAGQSTLPSHPSLPLNPNRHIASASNGSTQKASGPSTEKADAELVAATVFAAPQLRDLKKEATAFVPSALKRKRTGAGSGLSSKINAAPSDFGDEETSDSTGPARPDLLMTLKGQFGHAPSVASQASAEGEPKVKKPKNDDYEKFVEEMGDILG